MQKQLEGRPDRSPVLKKAAAGLVLVAVAAVAIWVVIGVIKAVFVTVLVIAVVLAALWAVKTIVW
jgi:hypothetical protein